jgi:hypothetical protein
VGVCALRTDEAGWWRAGGALEHADKHADAVVAELVRDGGDVFAEGQALSAAAPGRKSRTGAAYSESSAALLRSSAPTADQPKHALASRAGQLKLGRPVQPRACGAAVAVA